MSKFYKYRGNVNLDSDTGKKLFERDINMISNSEIWCSNLENLNDPFEGLYKMNNFNNNLEFTTTMLSLLGLKKKSQKINNQYIDSLEEIYKLSVQNCGIYSLTRNYKNNLMWSHYGNSHKGYCIEYEFKDLKTFDLKFPEHFPPNLNLFEKVKYSENPFNLDNIFPEREEILNFLFYKNKEWSYEEEWRIVTFFYGKYFYNPKCVKAIIFGLNTKSNVIEIIINKLKNLNIEFFKMKRITPFLIEKEKI